MRPVECYVGDIMYCLCVLFSCEDIRRIVTRGYIIKINGNDQDKSFHPPKDDICSVYNGR